MERVLDNNGDKPLAIPYQINAYHIIEATGEILRAYGTITVPVGGSLWREGANLEARTKSRKVVEKAEMESRSSVWLEPDEPIEKMYGRFLGYL